MTGLLVAMVATELISGWFYEREVESKYLHKAVMLTQAIQRDIVLGGNEAESLAWWHARLEQYDEIDFALTEIDPGLTQAYVRKLDISEAEDVLEIVTPFDATHALRFSIHDRTEPGGLWAYYGGYVLIYLILGALLYFLTHLLYRYIEGVRIQAQRVAQGDYSATLPTPRFVAFSGLHADLNHMTRALRDKTRENHLLTAAIHHELRTPLTRLRLALDMATITSHAQDIPGLLRDMDYALNELSGLMEDLLTLSRLRLTQQPPPPEDIALDRVVADLIERADDTRIKAELVACHLYANRALLERALSNLIENARKYARQRIAITLVQHDDNIAFEINDDGPGIPEDAIEWVRQPFFRVDTHRNRRTGGVGLGLAIADLALKDSGAVWTIGRNAWGGASLRLQWRTAGAPLVPRSIHND